MVKIFRFISRLSIVALIFFSLQGEVIMRYAEFLHGKTEQQVTKSKSTAERQQLIKLQCFTQKFRAVALPPQSLFVFEVPLTVIPPFQFYRFNAPAGTLGFTDFPSLRGPPALV